MKYLIDIFLFLCAIRIAVEYPYIIAVILGVIVIAFFVIVGWGIEQDRQS